MRTTDKGESVCNFRMGCNSGKDETVWVRCALWGKRGAAAGPHFKKGVKLMVSGTLTVNEWTKDGKTNQQLEIRVNEFEFGNSSRKEDERKNPFEGGR